MVSYDFQNTSDCKEGKHLEFTRTSFLPSVAGSVSPSAGLVPKCSQVRGKCVCDLCSHLQGMALPPGHLSSHCLIPGQGIFLALPAAYRASGSWKNREQMPPGAWKSLAPHEPLFPQGPPPWDWAGVDASLHLFSRPGN